MNPFTDAQVVAALHIFYEQPERPGFEWQPVVVERMRLALLAAFEVRTRLTVADLEENYRALVASELAACGVTDETAVDRVVQLAKDDREETL